MQKIVILLVNGGLASTAVLPLDIFKSAGTLWNALNGAPLESRFEVVTASADGKPVIVNRHLSMTPEMGCADVESPDLAFVAAGGLEFDAMVSQAYDPVETIAIYYDSYRNLVAQGVIPSYSGRRDPNPWPTSFVPDP